MTPYYQDDYATIYHGDARDILPHLEPVDLVLTDPPYGVGYAEWDSEIISASSWLPFCQENAPIVLVTPGNGNQYDYPKPIWTGCWFRPGSIQHAKGGQGFSHWEPILIYGKNPLSFDAKRINNTNQGLGSLHPCPKPLDLFKWLIDQSTESGETILDPFMGSGTTLRAAKDLGRKAIGIEIEEKYCEIAVDRLRQEVLAF